VSSLQVSAGYAVPEWLRSWVVWRDSLGQPHMLQNASENLLPLC